MGAGAAVAAAHPVLALARDGQHGSLWLKVIARSRSDSGVQWPGISDLHRDMVGRFTEAFGRALPALSAREAAFRFHFLTGAAANALVDTRTLHLFGEDLPHLTSDPIGFKNFVKAFLVGGMRSDPSHPLP